MSLIEEYWEDISIYSVEFSSRTDLNKKWSTRKFRKTLVFPSNITKEEVFRLVPICFHNIDKVLYVDELTDGLLLKEQ